jgi:hypothetical protein
MTMGEGPHCDLCQGQLPPDWLDCLCPRCLDQVHTGLAQLLLRRFSRVLSWGEFLRALPWLLRR